MRDFLRLMPFILFINLCACGHDADNDKNLTSSSNAPYTLIKNTTAISSTSTYFEAIDQATPRKEPSVYPLRPEYIAKMKLSDQMAKALRNYDPKFQLWSIADYPEKKIKYYPFSEKTLPYGIKGDYNGDGIEDMALAGHNKDANITVVLMSFGTGYHAIEIENAHYYSKSREHNKELPYTANEVLVFKKKGRQFIIGDMAPKVIDLKNDGFIIKRIKWFNFFRTFTFTRGGDIGLYQWNPSADKFDSYPLSQISDDHYITLKYPGKDVDF